MYDPAKVPPLRPIELPRKPNYFEAIRHTRRLDRLTESDFRKIQAVYLGMISYSDWMFGELLAAVERTGHAEDTAVLVFSDHGEWGGDYGLVEKWPNALEDVLTRVPLIARVPGMTQGHVSEEIVELFDIMATTLDLAGIRAEHTHFAQPGAAALGPARRSAARGLLRRRLQRQRAPVFRAHAGLQGHHQYLLSQGALAERASRNLHAIYDAPHAGVQTCVAA